MTIDPVTLEIIASRLTGVLDEAASQFVRTSFSPLVRDSNDFAIVITDTKGRSLGQSSLSIPSFIGTLPASVKRFIASVDTDALEPDAIYICNDPWFGTGHIHDITTIAPIIGPGGLAGYVAIAHHLPDIGGRIRGVSNRDIYEEGLQIPLTKLLGGGERNRLLIQLIERNVRTPAQTMGDIWASASICGFLTRRSIEIMKDYGLSIDTVAEELISRCETALRQRIAAIPEGTYSHDTFHDGFDRPIRVRCTVTIKGSDLAIDLAGSSEQQPFSVNVVPAYAFAYLAFAVKSVLCPDLPNNEGICNPITLEAPPGSIFNPSYPAATGARAMMGHMLVPAFMCALAEVLPDDIVAEGAGVSVFLLSGETQGRPYSTTNFISGGQGASARSRGTDVTCFPSNIANSSLEVMENQVPILFQYRRKRVDSGGGGAHPGGDGLELAFDCLGADPIYCNLIMTRSRIAPAGLKGGLAGAVAEVELNGGAVEFSSQIRLQPGDRLRIASAGGGGYGAEEAAT